MFNRIIYLFLYENVPIRSCFFIAQTIKLCERAKALTSFECRKRCTVPSTNVERVFEHFVLTADTFYPMKLKTLLVIAFSRIRKRTTKKKKKMNYYLLHVSTRYAFKPSSLVERSWLLKRRYSIKLKKQLTNVKFDIKTRSDKFTTFNKLIPPHWLR